MASRFRCLGSPVADLRQVRFRPKSDVPPGQSQRPKLAETASPRLGETTEKADIQSFHQHRDARYGLYLLRVARRR